MRGRHAELTKALAADRFDDIQRQVPTEIQFVQSDQESRLSAAIDKRKRARLTEQRTKEVAAELRAGLERGRAAAAEGNSDAQRLLAQKLKEPDGPREFERWLEENTTAADAVVDKLDRQLAELSVLLQGHKVAEFEARMRVLNDPGSLPQRALLLDSLSVDLAQAVKESRRRAALLSRLRALIAELRCVETKTAASAAESLARSLEGDTDNLEKLEANATKILEAERAVLSARWRRDVVLKGLAALGYQVNEGLETAWVQAGRLVLKRPSQPGYGVELGGTGDSGRIQARVVAFRAADAAADTARDLDAERLWCSDVAALGQQLASVGSELLIDRALPAGAAPLKAVAEVSAEGETSERAPALRERALPRT
jgi:hypothetical protein